VVGVVVPDVARVVVVAQRTVGGVTPAADPAAHAQRAAAERADADGGHVMIPMLTATMSTMASVRAARPNSGDMARLYARGQVDDKFQRE
jgi:hypothetical protein